VSILLVTGYLLFTIFGYFFIMDVNTIALVFSFVLGFSILCKLYLFLFDMCYL